MAVIGEAEHVYTLLPMWGFTDTTAWETIDPTLPVGHVPDIKRLRGWLDKDALTLSSDPGRVFSMTANIPSAFVNSRVKINTDSPWVFYNWCLLRERYLLVRLDPLNIPFKHPTDMQYDHKAAIDRYKQTMVSQPLLEHVDQTTTLKSKGDGMPVFAMSNEFFQVLEQLKTLSLLSASPNTGRKRSCLLAFHHIIVLDRLMVPLEGYSWVDGKTPAAIIRQRFTEDDGKRKTFYSSRRTGALVFVLDEMCPAISKNKEDSQFLHTIVSLYQELESRYPEASVAYDTAIVTARAAAIVRGFAPCTRADMGKNTSVLLERVRKLITSSEGKD